MESNPSGEAFNKATLARTLNRWGFEFGQGVRSQHLKEKDHVIAARQRYLRKIRDNSPTTQLIILGIDFIESAKIMSKLEPLEFKASKN